ncbi:5'/3'-nucleotidase SurE [Pseudonocardia sp. MH-G8]|uniref:5'/3'-nucleotidase SurE n=1 Tax=Pseudonocardia sp. MH-G8 TaxID=1854588 RepID=UPI000BA17584|nr:5'/3'-nucleotidase SurE [Pseudonocardia sp. MH-G8]OZM75944.1 5'/3'-nucleotidase SurE [Pseudonocardia sp. MH-G8]
MRALVTNDDGIDSPGLAALTRLALAAGLDVVVAAPSEQSSGASAAITAVRDEGRTLIERHELGDRPELPAWGVRAQPGHIVVAALTGWLDPAPDLVLSGVNRGANVGRAVLHSGTVGAILTAALHGVRGLAVSLDVPLDPQGERHWDAADDVFPRVLELLLDAPPGTSLSLNVPDRDRGRHRELRHARLAAFGTVQARVDEVEDGGLRLGEVEVGTEPEEGTDGALLAAGHPTLTALRSISEDEGRLVPDWLASASRVRS